MKELNLHIRSREKISKPDLIEVNAFTFSILDENNIKVAEVYLRHFLRPINFFFITGIEVIKEHRGSGIGRAIIKKINHFLDSRGVPGVLVDFASYDLDNHEDIFGFYQRHGWLALIEKDSRTLFYNSNKTLDKETISRIYSLMLK